LEWNVIAKKTTLQEFTVRQSTRIIAKRKGQSELGQESMVKKRIVGIKDVSAPANLPET
jgi:hypothetical protein